MTKKTITIVIVMLVALIYMAGTAAATGDILIHPDTPTITVGVDPNAVSPPLEVEYVGWGTAGTTAYNVIVSRNSDNYVPPGCTVSGTITGDPQTVELTTCIIPTSDVGAPYHVYASAACPTGGCEGTSRSRSLTVDAPLNPIPELGTSVLVATGLIGLLGLVRSRRRD